jgi:hypothetical protein
MIAEIDDISKIQVGCGGRIPASSNIRELRNPILSVFASIADQSFGPE